MITWRLFGESHSPEIGIEVRNLPFIDIDPIALHAFLARRSLGAPRKEIDQPHLAWQGQVFRATILNLDARPEDYDEFRFVPRPGHADYAAYLKTGRIPTGGGKWSGRLTAPLCVAGFIAIQHLQKRGISITAKVIHEAENTAKDDSSGALVEVVAQNFPKGYGDAGSEGLESKLAAAFFSIPAVKGVEFGDGFQLASQHGSEANDAFIVKNGEITLKTNHCGGILGGVSMGTPIVARLAFKPTPSIAREQDSVNLKTLKPVKISVRGRHDHCVAYRACPAVESVMALILLGELACPKETCH